jgi:hypothetical protein
MYFVALYSLKEGIDQVKITEVITRRAEYEHPMKLVAEYFSPNRNPTVISVYETDDANTLLINSLAWLDVFDIQVLPVVTWDEGMQALSSS